MYTIYNRVSPTTSHSDVKEEVEYEEQENITSPTSSNKDVPHMSEVPTTGW